VTQNIPTGKTRVMHAEFNQVKDGDSKNLLFPCFSYVFCASYAVNIQMNIFPGSRKF